MIDWIGYTAVSVFGLAILGAMFALVKATTDDSDNYRYLKEIVNALFGSAESAAKDERPADEAAAARQDGTAEPAFEEACPGCGATVTERDRICPSCGLRLIG